MAEAFARGSEPVTVSQVAQQVRVPEGIALAILVELERHGYAARVARPDGAYLPRRSPASVKVADLWHDLGGGIALSDGDMLDRLLAEAARSTVRTLGNTAVQDLLDAGAASAAAEATPPSRDELTELA
jgi:DNA-binding IscR family transcriptional regulator